MKQEFDFTEIIARIPAAKAAQQRIKDEEVKRLEDIRIAKYNRKQAKRNDSKKS